MRDTAVFSAMRAKAIRDEATVKALLSRWVSELEPAVAMNRRGDIIGLTPAGALVDRNHQVFILRI
jgi:hypothetical protein